MTETRAEKNRRFARAYGGEVPPERPEIAYWSRQPCNSEHSQLSPGMIGYWDEVRRKRYHVESHIPEHAGFTSWQDLRVLELGCGIGTDAVSFALGSAYVTALDASTHSLDLARLQAQHYRVADLIDFQHRDLDFSMMTPDHNRYDLIWSHGVLHHLKVPYHALRYAYESLKPGGEIRCMVYHKWSSKWLACLLGLMQPEAQSGVPIVRVYSRRGGRRLLESAGFEDVRTQVRHVFPYRWRPYREGLYRLGHQAMFVPFERLVGWHLLMTARKPK